MRTTVIAPLAAIAVLACLVSAADFDHLRPTARWLGTERLKGILFHHTNIQPGVLDEVKIWDRPLSPDEINREARR